MTVHQLAILLSDVATHINRQLADGRVAVEEEIAMEDAYFVIAKVAQNLADTGRPYPTNIPQIDVEDNTIDEDTEFVEELLNETL